jgi:excisionase family DNA binding protein
MASVEPSPGEEILTSAEVAALLHVSPATVRRWAEAGLLPHERTAGGHRRFRHSEVDHLRHEMEPDPEVGASRWIRQLILPSAPLAVDAALLQERSRRGGWYRVAEHIDEVAARLERMRARGELTPLEEQVACERLARSLARAADSIPTRPDAPRVLLAAAEGEPRALGLALAEITIREGGWPTVWAGAGVATRDLELHAASLSAAFLAVWAGAASGAAALAGIAGSLGLACREARAGLLLCGRGPWPDPPAHGRLIRSFPELRAHMVRSESGQVH